jgi:cytochrome c-type biogenesis protein CcmH
MPTLNPFWSVTLFWVAAALCVAIALAFVLPPLLRRKPMPAKAARRDINIAVYRDQMQEMEADRVNGLLSDEQFQTGKIELESRLAEDALAREAQDKAPLAAGGRKLGFVMAGAIPVAAFGLYFWLGNPTSLIAIAEAQANPATETMHVPGSHDIGQMIAKVEEKTKADPNDAEAWSILAKTYAAVEKWPEALKAYEKAMTLKPGSPAIMTGYAEALAINNNRNLSGKPMALILKALEQDPNDIKGLELAGIAAFQEKSYAKAAYYFKHLLKQLPPESPYAQDIEQAKKEAERLSHQGMTGLDNLAEAAPAGKERQPATPGAVIHGHVDIAPALKSKVGPQDVIFLFARSGEAGAPVAAIRAPAAGFPLEFELNDAMAMNPANRLSNFKEVSLTARVAKSGDIKGAAGDLEGNLAKVKVGATSIKLVIDTVRQ